MDVQKPKQGVEYAAPPQAAGGANPQYPPPQYPPTQPYPQQPAYGTPAYNNDAPPGYPPYGSGYPPQGQSAGYYEPGKVPPSAITPARRKMGSMSILAIVLFIGGIFLPLLWVVLALMPCCLRRDHPERPLVAKLALGAAIALFVYIVLFAVLMGVGWRNWRTTGYNHCPCTRNDIQCRNYYGC